MISKKIKIIVIASLIAFSFSNASANKVVVFPDSKSLQPMPINTFPAVSQNIQAKIEDYSSVLTPTNDSSSNSQNTNPAQNVAENKSSFGYLEIIASLFAVLVIVFWVIRTLKNKKNS